MIATIQAFFGSLLYTFSLQYILLITSFLRCCYYEIVRYSVSSVDSTPMLHWPSLQVIVTLLFDKMTTATSVLLHFDRCAFM